MTTVRRSTVSAEDAAWADAWLKERGVDGDRRIAVLNPGASWPAKTWSADRFAELARRMIETLNLRVLLVAGPGQREAMTGLTDMAGYPCPVVETGSLTRLAALIQRCDLFVSNDCGPMHIAAAVGTPTIGLFGPSSPRIWFPYSKADGHVALEAVADDCCGRDFCVRPVPCIESISPQRVLEAAESILRGASSRPAE